LVRSQLLWRQSLFFPFFYRRQIEIIIVSFLQQINEPHFKKENPRTLPHLIDSLKMKYFTRTMFKNLLLIGAGSSIGGILRYLTQLLIQKKFPSTIPLGTLTANIAGCLIIGIIYGLAERGNYLSPATRLLLATGFCGGYTTFSSFAIENIQLLNDGKFLYTAAYVLMSLIFGFAAVYIGSVTTKLIS
jgi:CrcB protein